MAMNANEFMQLPVRVGPGNHAEDAVEQHRRKLEPLALLAPTVGNGAQNVVERPRQATTSDSGCHPQIQTFSLLGIVPAPSKPRELNSPALDALIDELKIAD